MNRKCSSRDVCKSLIGQPEQVDSFVGDHTEARPKQRGGREDSNVSSDNEQQSFTFPEQKLSKNMLLQRNLKRERSQ